MQRLNLSVFLGDTIKLHNKASLCDSGYVANVFKDTCIKLQVLVPLDHPLNIRILQKLTSRPADENELDEPMGILPSPHIRSGHTTHHRGPINLSSLLSPPSYPYPLPIFPSCSPTSSCVPAAMPRTPKGRR